MRNYLVSLLTCAALAASSSAFAQQAHGPERTPGERRPEHVASHLGDVLIRTDGVRVFVMVDTILDRGAGPDGVVDQWFILETAEPLFTPISEHIPGALIVYTPGALRVTSPEHRFELVLESEAGPGEGTGTRVVGIGLSHNRAEKTSVRIADEVRRSRLSTTCMGCEVLNPDPGGGDGSSGTCSSGGAGATQCSATQGSNACSITCSTGYYACCNYSSGGSPYCRCVKN